MANKNEKIILWFDEINMQDVGVVGGKCASLGEMYSNLTGKGIEVPFGFAISAYTYRKFVEESGVQQEIRKTLQNIDTNNVEQLQKAGKHIRNVILSTPFSPELNSAISDAYLTLCNKYDDENTDVAVRSSATAEDLPDASFAGQQDTYLNIRGIPQLLNSCKSCFASLFTDRAIKYREDKKFDHFNVYLSVGVQKMVRSDLGASGVMFTIDTESGFPNAISIDAGYGLGENVVQGAIIPDEYVVFKTTLKQGFCPIISKKMGTKRLKMIYTDNPLSPTKNVAVHDSERDKFVLSDEEIVILAKWGAIIEDYYSELRKTVTPMDIEWAKDGKINKLFIVQARPETVISQRNKTLIKKYALDKNSKKIILTSGVAIGDKIGSGKAVVMKDTEDMKYFEKGAVLVAKTTDPDWEPIMKLASAIVTDTGGRKSHTAIVARELGVPAVAGTNDATLVLKTGDDVTVSCAEGETGFVYSGKIDFNVTTIDMNDLSKTKTKIMADIATGDSAFEWATYPFNGVGILRVEKLIHEKIKIHPLALFEYDELLIDKSNKSLIQEIENITIGYPDKTDFFVEKLSRHIGKVAGAFYPSDVIVRFTDYTSSDFSMLVGGKEYEPDEFNPLIGYRGAYRFNYVEFLDAFEMECEAIKNTRKNMGLVNVKVAVPFVRTVSEGVKIVRRLEKFGLKRGEDGLSVFLVVDTPSNVMMLDELSEVFDGFLINVLNLTQLTLGVDRDAVRISRAFDMKEEGVKKMIELSVSKAKKNGKPVNIIGEEKLFTRYLNENPDYLKFLIELGVDSITIDPEDFIKIRTMVSENEH